MSLAGKLFHNLGAKEENAKSPTDLYFCGTYKWICEEGVLYVD